MKLNNKGFAISSMLYLILIMAIVLITATLAILSSRKLILDKLKVEASNDIYNVYNLTYRETLDELKTEAINYATENNITKDSIKISDLNSLTNTIDIEILDGYKLSEKYLTIESNNDSYDVYLGRSKVLSGTSVSASNIIDIVDYKIYGNSEQKSYGAKYTNNLTITPRIPISWSDVAKIKIIGKQSPVSQNIWLCTHLNQWIGIASGSLDWSFKNGLVGTADKTYAKFANGEVNDVTFTLTETGSASDYITFTWDSTWSKEKAIKRVIFWNSSDEIIADVEYMSNGRFFNNTTNSYLNNYTGGASSATVTSDIYQTELLDPTPETPIAVKGVGDNKNFWNPQLEESKWISASDGYAISNIDNTKMIRIPAKEGDTYTLRAQWDTLSGNNIIAVSCRDENDNALNRMVKNNIADGIISVTAPAGTASICFARYVIEPSKIQIEKGLVATDYTPYKSIKIESGSKNLLPKRENPETNIGVTVSYDESDNTFVLNGTTTNAGDISLIPKESLINMSDTKKYVFKVTEVSGTATLGEGTGITYAYSIFDGTNSKYIRGDTNLNKFINYSFSAKGILPNNGYNVYLQCWRVGTVFNNYKIRIQLEEGDTATSYEPYVESITNTINLSSHDSIKKIGDSKDYLAYKDQKIFRNIGNKKLGSISYISDSTNNNFDIFVSSNFASDSILGVDVQIFSNIGGFSLKSISKMSGIISNTNASWFISFKKNYNISTIELANEWLRKNEVRVYYPLATTDETETASLPKININNGGSLIKLSTDVMPSDAEFTVIQKIKQL